MAFQFQCPQGHLLAGEESQSGQQCTCPMCGILFIIPHPIVVAPAAPAPSHYSAAPQFPAAPHYGAASMAQFPSGSVAPFPDPPAPPTFPPVGGGGTAGPIINAGAPGAGPAADLAAPVEPRLLHIPCPKGHELEVPPDMLDQDVLCPHCNSQFRLRERNSVEFKRKKEIEIERSDNKRGQAWLNWAIIIAVIVVLGLIIMIAASRS